MPSIPEPRSPERPAPPSAGQSERSPWRCLRHGGMRWWSAANLVSNVGTWMQLTVQNLLVLHITGSAATTGVSLAVQAAPGLLLGLVGGAAVDAWPRKLTAAVSQVALAAIAFTTAVLVAFDLLDVAALMVLSALTGLVATVEGPACALLGNELVPVRDVSSAIALGSVVHSAGRLIGVACAGVAVGALGTAAAYAANGLSFLFVAAVIPFLRPVDGQAPAEPDRRARRPVAAAREGLAYFMGRPRLVALTVVTAVSAMFGRNYGLTLAVLVTGPLAGSDEQFGTVATVLAVGGILGAVLAGRMQRPSVQLIGAFAAVGALLQVVAGLSPTLVVLLVVTAPMAVAESLFDTAGTTVLQTDPPPGMRGRVLGVWRTAQTGWGLAGPPLLGLLMEWAGPRGALVLGGLLIVTVIGAGALGHTRRTALRSGTKPVAAHVPESALPSPRPAPHVEEPAPVP
ncbi:MFS transporter [Streptomyces melanosporofaciens]|uniref:Predicted arabinose efflux permease, MFS family n=1 Tax=Streptomyces melanosporofaciens TaxID=67327 RepID=A0A1H4X572_STRMJ|nr:MFS transporter [Streptomyces melanosporofaciens]SED00727.1 Predicted arabinose efflux permease, MFS family [Streptomyces melanosporofaciens]